MTYNIHADSPAVPLHCCLLIRLCFFFFVYTMQSRGGAGKAAGSSTLSWKADDRFRVTMEQHNGPHCHMYDVHWPILSFMLLLAMIL